LAACLCGKDEVDRLRRLSAAHSDAVEASLLAFHAVAGRTERLAELALSLGFVERWCTSAQSSNLVERRQAFAKMASLAHAPAVRMKTSDLAEMGLKDEDKQVRLEAARALIASGSAAQVTQVFEAVITDSPLNRLALAPLLRRHAGSLCF